MQYNPTSRGYPRTTAYRGTVKWLDDADLQLLERDIAKHNANVRKHSRKYGRPIGQLLRVTRKGRGPRRSSPYHTLHHEAKRWDIYVQNDTANQYDLNRELETGMTPSELKRKDKMSWQIRMMEINGQARKHGRSIPFPTV